MASGSEIASAAARAAAENVTKAVEAVAERPTNSMSSAAVDDAKPELTAAIKAAIEKTPEIQNALSTEAHWWQKRTVWSTIASGLAGASVFAIAAADYMSKNVDDGGNFSWITLGFAAWAGYSAWRAGRPGQVPLGTSRYPLNRG